MKTRGIITIFSLSMIFVTLAGCDMLSQKWKWLTSTKYQISGISTGIQVDEALRILRSMCPQCEIIRQQHGNEDRYDMYLSGNGNTTVDTEFFHIVANLPDGLVRSVVHHVIHNRDKAELVWKEAQKYISDDCMKGVTCSHEVLATGDDFILMPLDVAYNPKEGAGGVRQNSAYTLIVSKSMDGIRYVLSDDRAANIR